MVADVALILVGTGFAVALALTGVILRAPEALKIYAHPNVRSFHRQPTLTAGGLTFVLPLAGYLIWLALQGAPEAVAIGVGGALLALIGLLDDMREVSARIRLLAHLMVAGGVAWCVLDEPSPWVIAPVALGLAWHVNLYNFMDGIDGLAASQALVFAVGAHVAGSGLPGWPGDVLWLAAGSVLAFLVVNWPPARLFMGDVGSYFLGLLTGAVAILLWQQQTLALAVSLVLLTGFWFDATYTLIVRVFTGQAFTQPHKTHVYQKIAAKRGHLWTTVCYWSYGVLWLLPLSWLCARQSDAHSLSGYLWLLPAVAPMAVAAVWLGAGMPDSRSGDRSHNASDRSHHASGGSHNVSDRSHGGPG